MEEQRSILVNEGDTRKLDIFTQGDLSVTPSGIPVMASDANGTIRILKQDNAGNLNVNVQAGGAGGGVAQTQVRDSAGNWTDVGYSAGKQNMPVYFAGSAASSSLQIIGVTNSVGVYMDTWRQTGAVRVGQVDGTVAVYFSQSNPKVNLGTDILNVSHTASIGNAGNSVSGSTSGVSVSGVQIVAPEANRVIKVFAFSITTTAQVHLTSKFTNGSGTSPVELWRVGMQAPSQGMAGANLAVTPPGYLFATPSGATLCIVNDSASLIHYSVSYFKESA